MARKSKFVFRTSCTSGIWFFDIAELSDESECESMNEKLIVALLVNIEKKNDFL